MPFFALIGGIYLIFMGITEKGSSFKTKMGTPIPEEEVKTVKIIYIVVGAVLLLIALLSGIDLFLGS